MCEIREDGLNVCYTPVQIPVTACSRPLTQVLPDPGKLISPTAPLPVPFINLQLPVLRRSTFLSAVLDAGCYMDCWKVIGMHVIYSSW